MFSDTHCHLSHLVERGVDLGALFSDLSREGCRLAFDIGTKSGDFSPRLERVREGFNRSEETEGALGVPRFVHFSCGIWPEAEAIADRFSVMKVLAEDIARMKAVAVERKKAEADRAAEGVNGFVSLGALGECGLDRYWNGPDAPGRAAAQNGGVSDDGPGTLDLAGEEELFALQLELAKNEGLAAIVHSRDAFAPTEAIIRNSGLSRGVIHCWSYGIAEARAFLDLGYHISFPGSITWPKKAADKDRAAELLRFVPRDRLLLETDSPYLTPAPHRGKVNTPYLVRHVYERAGEILELSQEALYLLVWENSVSLFGL